MKTPCVDGLIVKICCETTGKSESDARVELEQIGPERKLFLVEQILSHTDLYWTDKDVDKLSDMKSVSKRRKG